MSRLIVKGLAPYLDEEKIRAHFSRQGNVTDVKLMRKRSGESRRFAFIGYSNNDEAVAAVRYFNNSFFDTSKLEVELAKSFADPDVPLSHRERNRLREERLQEKAERLERRAEFDSRRNKRQKVVSSIDQEIEKNPQLQEFIEVTKPRNQLKSWENDMVPTERRNQEVEEAAKDVSDDEYQDLPKGSENAEAEESGVMEGVVEDGVVEYGVAEGGVDGEGPKDEPKLDETVSDLDWLKGKRIRIKENEGERNEAAQIPQENSHQPQETIQQPLEEPLRKETQQKEEKSPTDIACEQISQTGRLFLRNISYSAKEQDFSELLSPFGELQEVHIAIDTRTGTSKGFAYIQFADPSCALEAFQKLDKQIFQGRLLHILPGQVKKDHRLDEFDLKNLPLKKQRELKRKADASKAQFSWNSLYMNNDAVLNSVADKMGISKSELIDAESSSSAVKQALAEAHVIGGVRKFFESKGVDLTAFSKKEKDDRVVLIKNFPYGTSHDELAELLTPFGELKRFLVPPSGTIAIAEYRDAPAARAAFAKLAYRRFNKSILYLEKGPKDAFTRDPVTEEGVTEEGVAEGSVAAEAEDAKEAKISVDDVFDTSKDTAVVVDGPTVSVFVKNLNFSSTAQSLTGLFKSLPGFVMATIKTKRDAKKPDQVLSMGFGFVEFKTRANAEFAVKSMNDKPLDGHKLQLKLSHRQGTVSAASASKTKKSSKILVKNLPFEATRKDIFELFSSFGQLKSVRVPRKFDKSARGFAFVEFVLVKEAESAMDQLQGVHLLGRRLVMEFAEQQSDDVEDEIEKMTQKVKKQVDTTRLGAAMNSGKRRINLDEEEEFDELA